MLKLINIEKIFRGFTLNKISFEVIQGDYFVILGKSGAGKSLILEIIAGITKPDLGMMSFRNENIYSMSIQKRGFVLVYQDLALFPHLNVFENIAFPLKCRKENRKTLEQKVFNMADRLEISDLLNRMPHGLSGGESQRVALARALIIKPDILLLDEPLASLDIEKKADIQKLLKKINENGQTIIHVTHDFEETIALSNKVAILDKGKLVQIGNTDYVFKNPQNRFIANLSGIKNFFEATLTDMPDRIPNKKARLENTQLEINFTSNIVNNKGFIAFNSKDVIIIEKSSQSNTENNFGGFITDITKKFNYYEVTINIGLNIISEISLQMFEDLKLKIDQKIYINIPASAPYFIPLQKLN